MAGGEITVLVICYVMQKWEMIHAKQESRCLVKDALEM